MRFAIESCNNQQIQLIGPALPYATEGLNRFFTTTIETIVRRRAPQARDDSRPPAMV
jgi:hypothetical protein